MIRGKSSSVAPKSDEVEPLFAPGVEVEKMTPPPPPPPTKMKLSPDVPKGARTVNVRGTNPDAGFYKFTHPCSVDVNFDYRSWAAHSGPWRNLKHWSPFEIFRDSQVRRIMFPDVFLAGAVASTITYYNHLCALAVYKVLDTDRDGNVSMVELKAGIDAGIVEAHHVMGTTFFTTNDMVMMTTVTPFTLTAMALGMMLAFRTQNCSARYNEARMMWGATVNEGRAVSSRVLSLVEEYPKDSDVNKGAVHLVKCVMTFSHTLKYHLTTDGHAPDLVIRTAMTDAEVEEAKGKALLQELESVWDYDDPVELAYVDRLLGPGVGSRPLHVLQEMSHITSSVFAKSKEEGGAGLHPQHVESIYHSITRFQDVLGACERLYKTPIYSGATRFTSQCTWLWTNTVPLALYGILGPMGTVPVSVIVAMFMFGLEDMGARMEQPFAALPLWQYCDGIDGGCRQMLRQHENFKKSKSSS